MTKKQIFILVSVFIVFFVWTAYEIAILHRNIRKVRKEAWFDTNDRRDAEMKDIKYCLEHLESRIDQFHGKDPEYPNGYPLWEKKETIKRDPLIEYMIDQCL